MQYEQLTLTNMKTIWRFIKRTWYKLDRYSPFYSMAFGKFRVLYRDGQRTIPMDYKTAKDYAKMFGGKVIDNF